MHEEDLDFTEQFRGDTFFGVSSNKSILRMETSSRIAPHTNRKSSIFRTLLSKITRR